MLARLQAKGAELIHNMLQVSIHTVRKITEKSQPRQRTRAHLQAVNRTLDLLCLIRFNITTRKCPKGEREPCSANSLRSCAALFSTRYILQAFYMPLTF